MFERIEALVEDLRKFAADPTIAVIPFSFTSHDAGACLLQLAAGRTPASLGLSVPVALDFETARRFLAYIVFDRKNNYFTLLCVDSNAPDEAIKDNYRRLIALVHPDANPVGFPADAASRVNLGYAVLSNAEARTAYAESIDRLPIDAAVDAREHQCEANGALGGSRPQRRSPPRGLFAWLKRPRFGFGLIALATILILPVMIILTHMANDTGNERLISGRERSVKQQSVPSAESAIRPSVRTTNTAGEWNVAVLAENNRSLTRPKAATRSDTPLQTSRIVIAAADATVTPSNAAEQGAMGLSNGVIAPTPRNAFVSSPTSIRLALAPVPARLLDQHEPIVAGLEGKVTRSTIPQITTPILVDSPPRNVTRIDAANQSTAKTQPVVQTQNLPTVASRVPDARNSDSEDALLRFGSAYEQGSIDGVQALFASAMPGRSQMIADYQRVFSNTRQRNIRFVQLKHIVAGQRVSTVGQAVVNTVGADNKSSSQRVFLEIEVARVGNEVRIERMSNYALD